MKKEEKLKLIEEFLEKNPEATNMEIAKKCKLPIEMVLWYKQFKKKK